ncbi:MAG: siderophore-interacting protein, partial [Protaetiibacter sp.]
LGDETALPAIARWLEELPATARGVVAIEIEDAAEQHVLHAPDGMEITWLPRDGAPAGTGTRLADFARGLAVPAGSQPYVWAAGETHAVKPLRHWARELGLGKEQAHITGYWRRGIAGDILPGARGTAASLLPGLFGGRG